MNIKKLPHVVKLYRQAKGMSQLDFASLIGYSDRSTISKFESGQLDIPISKLEAISSALGVPVSTLLSLSDDDKTFMEIPVKNNAGMIYGHKNIVIDRKFVKSEHVFSSVVGNHARDSLLYQSDDIIVFERRDNYLIGDTVYVTDHKDEYLILLYVGDDPVLNTYTFLKLEQAERVKVLSKDRYEIVGAAVQMIRPFHEAKDIFF